MRRLTHVSEYFEAEDGSEVCPECGHIWNETGPGHYHDCRYFMLEDELDEADVEEDGSLRQPQLSLFRPAA
jgi:hypothetical protein